MTRIQVFSQPTQRELAQVVRDWRTTRQAHDIGDSADIQYGARIERWVKTTTCSNDIIPGGNTYPSFPASKFVVQFGDLEFDDTNLTNETPTFVAYDPADYRVALSTSGFYVPLTITRATLHHGRWYLEDDGHKLVLAKANEIIAAGDSGGVSIWHDNPHADSGQDVTAYHTWMEGAQDIESGTELAIRWFEKGRFYVIIEAECPA